MVIEVTWYTVKTPTLEGSPHSPGPMYYEVSPAYDKAMVIAHLKSEIKLLDPDTVLIKETNLDANELRKKGISVYKLPF